MISATILAYNSEKRLDEVLSALDFCDEIVFLDSGSSDNTLQIAAKYSNLVIYKHEGAFLGFGKMHQKATALAKNDWILSVDSDEVVSLELKAEILALKLNKKTVYAIPSKNFYRNSYIYSCGWSPDYKLRLFNKSNTNFDDKMVHENIITNGLTVEKLQNSFYHYSYENASDFIIKMQKYSDYYAKENVNHKSSSISKACRHALWAFIKSYILKKGFMQGSNGLIISAYNSQSAFWKYVKLYEANKI